MRAPIVVSMALLASAACADPVDGLDELGPDAAAASDPVATKAATSQCFLESPTCSRGEARVDVRCELTWTPGQPPPEVHTHHERLAAGSGLVRYTIEEPWTGEHVVGICPPGADLLDGARCRIQRLQVTLPAACSYPSRADMATPLAIPSAGTLTRSLLGGRRRGAIVEVDVAHPSRADLGASVLDPWAGVHVIHHFEPGLTPDLRRRAFVELAEVRSSPGWTLRVTDGDGAATGTLRGWQLKPVALCESDAACPHLGTTCRTSDHGGAARAIPDRGTLEQTLVVDEPGVAGHVLVDLDIDHPRARDLEILLRAPDGRTTHLWERTSIGAFPSSPDEFVGDLAGVSRRGTWTLIVHDRAAGQTGTLRGWDLRTTPVCL
jgi:subtilisin-like proprotein convertase family protein